MSLNSQEIAATRSELMANYQLAGLDHPAIARALGITPGRVRGALGLIEPVNSVDVWAVRDLLELAIERAGKQPLAFSALTEQIRPRARGWFPLRNITVSDLDLV